METLMIHFSSKYHHTEEQLDAELQLILRAQQDSAAFEPLYNKYYEQIFRFVYQRLDDREIAFDITSQVFLNALSALPRYEYKGVPFASWLYKIALNELHKAFRKDSSLRTINIDDSGLHELIGNAPEENSFAIEEHLSSLKTILQQLPVQEAEWIELRFFQHMSFKQIAEITDTNEATAKMRIYRVLEKLKKQLTQSHPIA